MTLVAGTRLGPYEITGALGAGGMGEVYRARDTNLGRDVALKVVLESFTYDPDRAARFRREAQLLAALNHPHIATIHGLEETDGTQFLVMELVEGESLAERIARTAGPSGPAGLPIDEALQIARQIAEALEAAHEQGIIHRDLKPANIALTADGEVKVLDFGLAKALDPVSGSAIDSPAMVTHSPTLSLAATQAGVILGTAAYMAPEQAKGRPADKRSDIWAFGCVLYEMLTGRRPFEGEDASETMAFVMAREPDWSVLPSDTPRAVAALLKECLAKDRRHRVADVSTILFVLRHACALGTPAEPAREAAPRARGRRAIPLAAAALSAAMAGYAGWAVRPPPPAPAVTRFAIPLPPDVAFTALSRTLVAISPDGRHLVYVANERLYLHALDQFAAEPIRGTEVAGADSPRNPFFSPDGRWIGFWANAQLRKVPVSGGVPVTISVMPIAPFGASWGEDDTILFGRGDGIWRVRGSGGEPERIIELDSGQAAHGPQMLPDGRTVLFTLAPGANWSQAQVVTHSLEEGTRTTLAEGRDARYFSNGYVVYLSQGSLIAAPYDAATDTLTAGVPLVEDVWSTAVGGAVHFTISASGSLAYVPGTSVDARTLVWVDRDGREEPLAAPPRAYVYPRLSPDGTRIALDVADGNRDIWVWGLARGTLTRLTFDPAPDRVPIWSADGRWIIFSSDKAGVSNLYRQAADGTAQPERLTESANTQYATTSDATRVVFRETADATGAVALMMLTLDPQRQTRPLIRNGFANDNAVMSPDGRWLAYESNTSGRDEIFVRPLPDVDAAQWQVSEGGGQQALWSPDGRELFYRGPDGSVIGVSVGGGPTFEAGPPRVLINGPYYAGEAGLNFRTYDVSRDGRRFLMIKNQLRDTAAGQRVIVVQNWSEELKRLVPVN